MAPQILRNALLRAHDVNGFDSEIRIPKVCLVADRQSLIDRSHLSQNVGIALVLTIGRTRVGSDIRLTARLVQLTDHVRSISV